MSLVSARAFGLALGCALGIGLIGCADHDPVITHIGQAYPAAPDGGNAITDAGNDSGDASDANDAAAPVTWCAAYQVINCVCQQCHRNPPLNGAPIPLVTYADTQAHFPLSVSKNRVWQTMQKVISTDFMPYMGDPTIKPKVLPLTPDQKQLMLDWLGQGAHDEGGQACDMTCDWDKGPPPGRE